MQSAGSGRHSRHANTSQPQVASHTKITTRPKLWAGFYAEYTKVSLTVLATVMTGGVGAEAAATSGSLVKATVYADAKFAAQLERQLAKDGIKSVQKTLSSLEKKLATHSEKLDSLKYKSSVEREIRTFNKQLDTLKQFMKEKGF